MHIAIDTERLYETSRNMNDVLRILKDNMDGIGLFVAGLEGDWEGKAEKAYASQITYVRSEFCNLEKALSEFSEIIAKVSQEYEKNEERLVERINKI